MSVVYGSDRRSVKWKSCKIGESTFGFHKHRGPCGEEDLFFFLSWMHYSTLNFMRRTREEISSLCLDKMYLSLN